MKPAHSLCVLLAGASSAFAGSVLVVGPQPTQIAEIQAAVDASVDGDVILVKSGTYATFSVPNKTVTIVADSAQVVNVDGAIRVRNLTAERTVVVSGLRATGRYGTGNDLVGDGFFATNCAGSIRLQDCVLRGYGYDSAVPCPAVPRPGVELSDCADVALVRCTVTGSSNLPRLAQFPGGPAAREGPGLVATNSSLAIHESTITGGSGGNLCNGFNDGTDGGDGVVLSSSFLFASRSNVAGGEGTSVGGPDSLAGWGGHGLVMFGASSQAHLLQCALVGGLGGHNQNCVFCASCCDGNDGSPASNFGGTLDTLSGSARVLAGSGMARESTPLALTVTGPPGDVFAVGIRRTTGFAWTPARFGVQLLSPPPDRFLILGTIPASGIISTSLVMPSVSSANPGQTYHLQLITSGSDGVPHYGSPLSIAVVDSAY